MKKANVIGVMLPGTPFSLMMPEYAKARNMVDMGIGIAIATDLNPNCYVENMQLMIQLSCYNMHLNPNEAICAATFNAACAIGKNNTIGSLEKGKQADIIMLNSPNHIFIPYHFGINLVEKVIKKGYVVI
jgi:imidazolonepropionase